MAKTQKVTLDDVAAAAGVSRATASRALSGSGPVSDNTKTKVMQTAERLAFSPNQAARTLASSRTQAIALVIPEPDTLVLSDPFLSGMIVGVSEAFHTTDYQLILVIVRPDEPAVKAMRILRPDRVDGAIIVSQHRASQISQAIADSDVPSVYVGRPWKDTSLYVDVNNIDCGVLATDHLIAMGAKRIACIAGPADMSPVQDRTQGWRMALSAAGLTPGPIAYASFTMHAGAESMRSILDAYPDVDAVFAQSDLMAAGAIRALKDSGHRIPAQVKVIGVDDAEVGRTTSPRLSSITNPAADLARQASQTLFQLLDGSETEDSLVPAIIEPKLIVRESTRM